MNSGKDDFPIPMRRRAVIGGVAAIAAGLALIPVSDSVMRVLHVVLNDGLEFMESAFEVCEKIVSAPALLAICAAIWLLDPRRRKYLFAFIICIFISGNLNQAVKTLTGRARPEYSVLLGGSEKRWIQEHLRENPDSPIRPDGSTRWLLFKPHRPWLDNKYGSFPSGHSNSAFVLAAFLILLYPRARPLWLALAAGCALARVEGGEHFLDDILAGGGLGWLFTLWFFSRGFSRRMADWFEARVVNRRWLRSTRPPNTDAVAEIAPSD